DLGRQEEARDAFTAAIERRDSYAEAYNNRGKVQELLGNLDEAIIDLDRAIERMPTLSAAHYNRGNALKAQGKLEDAMVSYDNAISLQPNYVSARNNRGNCYMALDRYDEALIDYQVAIDAKPEGMETYNNQGNAYLHLLRFDEADRCYDRAIALDETFSEAYWNKALLALLRGDFDAGWPLYEWRWKRSAAKTYTRSFIQPRWNGEDIAGKTLLIYGEQGLGDYIQFSRYVPALCAMGIKVVVEVAVELFDFLSSMNCPATFVRAGTELPDFDLHCPVMSLPLVCRGQLPDFPADIPYLFANAEKSRFWQEKLGAKTALRVGLAWSGKAIHPNDRNRSMRLAALAPILDLPAEFHILQKEIRPDDFSALGRYKLHSHCDGLDSFADTAALIDHMDLVISVDTSIAHAAAAMGKEVWMMLPQLPDWRWLMGRSDTPWYPTVTLYRQQAIGDWSAVIGTIAEKLKARSAS
ncbi:MAG: tetratricopeptide repeat protein, partial [Rhizomicrobium sp.]